MLNAYLIASVYFVTFVFGIVGNIWVMGAMIYTKLWCMLPSINWTYTARERSKIFIFFLSIADSIVLLTIPMSLFQLISARWIFGSLICRLHSVVDSSGKSMSVVLLTTMSFERYLIVCTRWNYASFPARISQISLIIGAVFGVLLPSIPQFIYTSLYEIPMEGQEGHLTNRTVCLQVITPERRINFYYANYTFVCSFVIPLFIMILCYSCLVRHVRRKFHQRFIAHKSPSSSFKRPNYLCSLTTSICRIAVFHFTCLAPFWFFNLVPVYAKTFGLTLPTDSEWWDDAKAIASMLPYINSSGNWLLYAFLNRDIRKYIWKPSSSRLHSTAVPSATVPFNNQASEYNESS